MGKKECIIGFIGRENVTNIVDDLIGNGGVFKEFYSHENIMNKINDLLNCSFE